MQYKPKAFIFDLNGTMIDDMAFHSRAWYDILNNDLNASLSKEEVNAQMYGKNSELLIRVFGEGRFTQAQMDELSMKKEQRYQKEFLPHLTLINGLDAFIKKANAAHIKMAIGSAAIPFNINFVLDNLHLHEYFPVIVSANDVKISKPDPETFLKAAKLLNVAPEDCIVFEDAPKGAEAAANAGMRCIVLTTMHGKEEFTDSANNILAYIKDYTDPFVQQLC